MGITYFKRFRMEYDLTLGVFDAPKLPRAYRLLPWNDDLIEQHAESKYRSFREEIDANVFPCLGDREGCLRLMNDISKRKGFVPEATWLLAFCPTGSKRPEGCGTIQGIKDAKGYGSIQNLGISPEHRNFGLGTILLQYALQGFFSNGVRRVTLEVTAQNHGAMRLYQRLGFRTTRTVYKASEVVYV